MRTGRILAAASLTAVVACAASSCGRDFSDAPRTWCATDFGNVRSRTFLGDLGGDACPEGEICADVGLNWSCCDPSEPGCADRNGGTEDGLYCSPGGWERLPMNGNAGTICAPTETCAMRKGKGCEAVCCDPRKDPDCGAPSPGCAAG